jgi:hypothetical protein
MSDREAHEHCRHCPGPDDPRHADPAFLKAEADCAFYEHPENLAVTGPGHRREGQPGLPPGAWMVFLNAETVAAIRPHSDAAGITVSGWVRALIDRSISALNAAAP